MCYVVLFFLLSISLSISPFYTPPFRREIGKREGEGAGMMVGKGEGKRKGAWEAGGQAFHVFVSSGLHSPDYIPLSLARQLFQFLPTEGRQVEKKHLVNCINSFWPPQNVWYPNPSLLTWQGEGVWCRVIGKSSCHSIRHLPSHIPLIPHPSSLSSALSSSNSQNPNRQIVYVSLASALALLAQAQRGQTRKEIGLEFVKRRREKGAPG